MGAVETEPGGIRTFYSLDSLRNTVFFKKLFHYSWEYVHSFFLFVCFLIFQTRSYQYLDAHQEMDGNPTLSKAAVSEHS